jgi:hypothetical protein
LEGDKFNPSSDETVSLGLGILPKNYDLTTIASRELPAADLQTAWHVKARQLAPGRKFKAVGVTVHDREAITGVNAYYVNIPGVQQTRTMTGTVESELPLPNRENASGTHS